MTLKDLEKNANSNNIPLVFDAINQEKNKNNPISSEYNTIDLYVFRRNEKQLKEWIRHNIPVSVKVNLYVVMDPINCESGNDEMVKLIEYKNMKEAYIPDEKY